MIEVSTVQVGDYYMVWFVAITGRAFHVVGRIVEVGPTLINNDGRELRLPHCVRAQLLEPAVDRDMVTTEVVVDAFGLHELSLLEQIAFAAREAA